MTRWMCALSMLLLLSGCAQTARSGPEPEAGIVPGVSRHHFLHGAYGAGGAGLD